jgi:membrane protease YdiL (CAAX protease family)
LLGVAAIVGALCQYRMFQDLWWRPMDAAWGIAATAPLLLAFGWLLRSNSNYAAGIRRFFEHVVRPIFGNWSILQLAVISALAGLCEEALFRGAVQGGLTPVVGAPAALVIASVAFGLAHPVSKQYVVAATVVGFFLGWLFIAAGNLLAPIVTHALYDFCALTWFLRLHRSDPR